MNESARASWRDGADPKVLPAAVREAFPALAGPIEIRPLPGGLLHRSLHVRTRDGEYVLQRVADVFAPEIHDNIDAVTGHLSSRGFPTTRLVPAIDGRHSMSLGAEGRWRLMTHLGGVSFRRLRSEAQAESAGRLVGRFHAALADFDRPLAPMGIPYRDTGRILAVLREALEGHSDHRLAGEMVPLGEKVLAAFRELGPAPETPPRVIHGDLKLENLLFEDREPPGCDRAFALIDLDTLMRAPLWVELGDAWRSWCNAAGEDTSDARFEMAFFEASARGFLRAPGIDVSTEERESLVTSIERLTLELCARYVTDALEERYFGWDAERFPGRGEHNAVRASGQWRFFEAARRRRPERESVLRSLA
ncbi:MAG TPA: aminoglycoside phosphotransferase family protein [Deltaproteobacteria bacterium]|nr:aminoglycoside phosphotransferase family protein [Deltaproteobacteria bacterium]